MIAKQPGEDGNLRTIVCGRGRRANPANMACFQSDTGGEPGSHVAPLALARGHQPRARKMHNAVSFSGAGFVSQFPPRDHVAHQFGHEKLLPLARFPPAGGIEFGIARAAHAKADARRKNPSINEPRAARMIVGSHHQDALPSAGLDEPRGFDRLFPRVFAPGATASRSTRRARQTIRDRAPSRPRC